MIFEKGHFCITASKAFFCDLGFYSSWKSFTFFVKIGYFFAYE